MTSGKSAKPWIIGGIAAALIVLLGIGVFAVVSMRGGPQPAQQAPAGPNSGGGEQNGGGADDGVRVERRDSEGNTTVVILPKTVNGMRLTNGPDDLANALTLAYATEDNGRYLVASVHLNGRADYPNLDDFLAVAGPERSTNDIDGVRCADGSAGRVCVIPVGPHFVWASVNSGDNSEEKLADLKALAAGIK